MGEEEEKEEKEKSEDTGEKEDRAKQLLDSLDDSRMDMLHLSVEEMKKLLVTGKMH